MEPKPEKPVPPKLKFVPKPSKRRVIKPPLLKSEVKEDADTMHAKQLLQKFNESSIRKPKVEKKVAASQVAFGYGGESTSIKSYGIPRGGSSQGSASTSAGYSSGLQIHKEYKEPWDYYSYYPVTLPLRRPYSGDPELLDEEEFTGDSENITYEGPTNPATELGLLQESLEERLLFFQLPATLPMMKRSTSAEGKEKAGSSKQSSGPNSLKKSCGLDELPEGFMGKMLVYRTGAVKLKLGDTLYDVSTGLDCVFSQNVVAVNTEQKHCCAIGELSERAIITPDVDCIVSSMADLG